MIVMVDTLPCIIARRVPAVRVPPVGNHACIHFYKTLTRGGSLRLFDGEQKPQAHGGVHSSYTQRLPR
jgi:hypothetical protein